MSAKQEGLIWIRKDNKIYNEQQQKQKYPEEINPQSDVCLSEQGKTSTP
jgi:hypothetical protein